MQMRNMGKYMQRETLKQAITITERQFVAYWILTALQTTGVVSTAGLLYFKMFLLFFPTHRGLLLIFKGVDFPDSVNDIELPGISAQLMLHVI